MYPAIMVMGVSGCGKSTIGAGLADAIGGIFLDGDDFHPAENVAQMAAGQPLNDAMRWPWLDALGQAVQAARADQPVVFACSALKKSYRDHLRAAVPDLKIAYLEAPRDVVTARLAERQGHYMPPSLLDSQLATLEVPQNAAAMVRIDQQIPAIIAALQRIV
ncbi:MAG: gluconokinase [Loktanella sp.]|nr:gluconokinase [Loktanella sp.]